MDRQLILLGLLAISIKAHNIFLGSLIDGSHLSALYDIALVLAKAGHNVTFINTVSGALDHYQSHVNIKHIDIIKWHKGEPETIMSECLNDIIVSPESDPLQVFSPQCLKHWGDIYHRAAAVFSSKDVINMFKEGKYDVIVGEKVLMSGMALLGTIVNVPVIDFEPTMVIAFSQIHNNIPVLLFSQPSIIYHHGYEAPYSFTQRLMAIKDVIKLNSFQQEGVGAVKPFLKEWGFSHPEEVGDSVKLFLSNDHTAFTFPFLRPPNNIPIGCVGLLDSSQDSGPVTSPPSLFNFLELHADEDIIYLCFGSYLHDMDAIPWFPFLIDILLDLNLKVIIRSKSSDKINPSSSLLVLDWVPQRDLLRSGKVKLFISHCGNNGRLETVFYNVPVLCIPQFADQFINAEVIKSKAFGDILLKENVHSQGREKIKETLSKLNVYQSNMKEASDILKNEPGNVKERLLFHINYVAAHGQSDYLVNHILKQQSWYQIYHIDLICFISSLFLFCILALISIFRKFYMSVKTKTE